MKVGALVCLVLLCTATAVPARQLTGVKSEWRHGIALHFWPWDMECLAVAVNASPLCDGLWLGAVLGRTPATDVGSQTAIPLASLGHPLPPSLRPLPRRGPGICHGTSYCHRKWQRLCERRCSGLRQR